MHYDLAIAYRVYPGISKTPLFFSDNKLKLSELGIKSLKLGLGNLKVKIFILLDNCPDEYKQIFLKYFSEDDLEFIEYNGIGNLATFKEQIQILLKQKYSENIYFAEDDYLYLPESFKIALGALKEDKNCFISLYDHLDNYILDFQNISSKISIKNNCHFRTNSSTCLTFLTTKKTLKKTKKTFLSYCKGNYDYCLWIALTKYNFFKIFNKKHIGLLLRARYYLPFQILFGKKYRLFSPIPALATHLESTGIAPVIDWEGYFNTLKKS